MPKKPAESDFAGRAVGWEKTVLTRPMKSLEAQPAMQPRRMQQRAAGAGAVLALMLSGMAAQAQGSGAAQLTVSPKEIATPVSPMLYGMMTEEINHAFEGGLYAEMVQNRTMRASWSGVEHWDLVRRGEASATLELDKSDGPSKALPTSLKLTVSKASAGNEAGVSNTGYWGMGLTPHTAYKGSFYAKADAAGPIEAELISDTTGAVLGRATVELHAGAWSRYDYTLTTGTAPASRANHLVLQMAHPGTVSFQLVSLFPPTYNNRPGGFRPDLMEKMAGLHPRFLRLPGGNYLEGDRVRDWYNWKETIGPMVDRPGHMAPWTYWSDDGMGLLEMLEWCEDLKIEPILAVYAGYSLQGEKVAAGSDLEPYVQSALEEVEYVTGDTGTKWGAQRAKDGHPAPFPLRYIEVGNEDFLERGTHTYNERYAQFEKALRAKYPQYKLIATMPVETRKPNAQPDLVDDHYYKPVGEMLDFTHHYDNAPRNGPKIFVGEWATLAGTPTPNWGGALADAAWMTSMERNSDLIEMASYAPLFINVNPGAGQWYTNMIGYDASKSYGSPSYYAQSLFGGHLGDGTAKSSITGAGERFFYSATVGAKDHVLHLKLVNASTQAQPLTLHLEGMGAAGAGTMYRLHAATYEATNTLQNPDMIVPATSKVAVSGNAWTHQVAPLSIEVIDLPLR